MLEYVHRIAEKIANEPLEDELRNWIIGETEDGHMPLVKKKKKQTEEEIICLLLKKSFKQIWMHRI